jgi:hypothetical protein
VDVALLLVGAFTIGWSTQDVARDLITFGTGAVSARNDVELEKAAMALASAIVTGGITVVMALLLRKSARSIQATRGAAFAKTATPRQPGLVKVGTDSQASRFWRQPTITGDPNLPPGVGSTTAFGDVTFSTAGTPTEQQLALFHELEHSNFSPKIRPFRTFRARLAMSGYTRTAILRYLEEAFVEGKAHARLFGVGRFVTGIRFPVANGYMTLQQLACEGAEIGKILIGAQQFSVQFVPAGPPSAWPQ